MLSLRTGCTSGNLLPNHRLMRLLIEWEQVLKGQRGAAATPLYTRLDPSVGPSLHPTERVARLVVSAPSDFNARQRQARATAYATALRYDVSRPPRNSSQWTLPTGAFAASGSRSPVRMASGTRLLMPWRGAQEGRKSSLSPFLHRKA